MIDQLSTVPRAEPPRSSTHSFHAPAAALPLSVASGTTGWNDPVNGP